MGKNLFFFQSIEGFEVLSFIHFLSMVIKSRNVIKVYLFYFGLFCKHFDNKASLDTVFNFCSFLQDLELFLLAKTSFSPIGILVPNV